MYNRKGTVETDLPRTSSPDAGCAPSGCGSPKHFDFVRYYGTKVVLDYNSPTCGDDIRAYTRNTCRSS